MPKKGKFHRTAQLQYARTVKRLKTVENALDNELTTVLTNGTDEQVVNDNAQIVRPTQHSEDCCRPSVKDDFASVSTSKEESASRKKLSGRGDVTTLPSHRKQSWTLAHVDQINSVFSENEDESASALCSSCLQATLRIMIVEEQNEGFASKLELQCQNSLCSTKPRQFMSSPRTVQGNGTKKPFEINPKMVLFSHEIGAGYAALQTLGAVLGMPSMHKKTFQLHDKKCSAAETEAGEEVLERAAQQIRKAYAETDPDISDALGRGEKPIINISVSFDGTWQKRGFSSLYGVGVCIDVLTGLVIDFAVLSKYCHACKLAEARGLSAEELQVWKEDHKGDCCINHHQSSKAMEQEAAKTLWKRSVTKFSFRYIEMLSDGDSSAFRAVTSMQPYGDTEIRKLECLNHAHKRMGTALRKLSKENRLGGNGRGKLTEKKCDNLQHFYRGAILNNLDSTEKMREGIWASFYHCISTDSDPQHHLCPEGENSWCWFRRTEALGDTPAHHADHSSSTFLSADVAKHLIPLYKRMSEQSLLSRLLHGGTQNRNESLNSTIWLRCPKTTFMGKTRVDAAVARAVGNFNEGATDLLNVMSKMWIDIADSTVCHLLKKDACRIAKGDAAAEDSAKCRRKAYASTRRLTIREEEKADGEVYGPGMD